MISSLLVPLDTGFGPHRWADGPPPFFPFPIIGGIMCLLFLALLIGGAFFLARRGKIGPPPWVNAANRAPEFEARKVLAERFARGDISTDEFLERASVLNWTPGSDQWPTDDGGKKRR
ncbi:MULTISPECIES: SHOCT domain-containing protein [Microlunatus]|uniref:Putative membrane protein n=1 Tax=Microlunatus parietis TaxID=682979 RepID=A0A7Y9LC71_9ACTN|nr:SHOCT domain-containing protein [Microlunatus parietis]NYE74549.1 putative membrane protein [Microlunatus parietis]